MECIEQNRFRALANSSEFSRAVYSEIEEVGWEHLVRLSEDLKFLSFRVLDKKGRVHHMEIQLDKSYPKSPPSISVDVPCVFNLKWSKNSRLKDLLLQFREHLEKLQEIWSILDEIDKSLWVVNLNQLSHANTCRQINLGNDCFIMLRIHPNDPKSLPECRFMGSGQALNSSRKTWQRNSKRWNKDKPFLENVANLLDAELPRPPDYQNGDQHVECGICYAQYLPVDDELGPKSGSGTDYKCDNTSCSRAFHSVCLADWLRSITTTRRFLHVIGTCQRDMDYYNSMICK
ncbi:E3 ubiquitin-protein ligase FANCL isoform X2 [Mangifera indica]|uniref:E3 ubiquitin-protein ligase FANCL isoform X2 n=2 Tax=Mangifera indica TaxID=29780 RepID=UPI001CFBFE73|nr:E3 ubiquitin-protein ligase FANCL isoform X2 [Mangifera indica]XP_044510862.1 E3 ubiquitin-protein ligase FANCL isoform X2 [Mangifera indica]